MVGTHLSKTHDSIVYKQSEPSLQGWETPRPME